MKKTFLVKVCYEKQTGEDNPGQVTETYLVEAETPSAAEKAVIDEIKPFVFGELEVLSISKRNFWDRVRRENGDYFYEAKVELITIDGDKETRKAVSVLIQDNTLEDAVRELHEFMKSNDCEITLVKKSAIIDILEEETNNENAE